MNRTIGDIMERDAYTCRYDQNLGEVVTLFNELRDRRRAGEEEVQEGAGHR